MTISCGRGEVGIRRWDSLSMTRGLRGCCNGNASVSIGRVLAFEEKEGSGVLFLKICAMEFKSAPADLRSIVAKLSKPSSIGKAQV